MYELDDGQIVFGAVFTLLFIQAFLLDIINIL